MSKTVSSHPSDSDERLEQIIIDRAVLLASAILIGVGATRESVVVLRGTVGRACADERSVSGMMAVETAQPSFDLFGNRVQNNMCLWVG